MKDYKKLIEALREIDFYYGCPCEAERMCEDADCAIVQAADAIEELQTKLGEQIELQTKEQGVLLDRIAELEQQLPKRGEWIEDSTTYAGNGRSNYKCSLCGKICGTWRSGLKNDKLPNWCGNCGADMRKMGAQE